VTTVCVTFHVRWLAVNDMQKRSHTVNESDESPELL
jgi:hypothetical protein